MKRLILMRHGKSDWSQGGVSDFERPLNKRGIMDSRNMGKWLAHNYKAPQIIICSAARRTRHTMQLFLLGLESAGVDIEQISRQQLESIYLASSATLLELVHQYLNDHDSLMLIAHNPGLEDLLQHYRPTAPLTPNGKLLTTANIAVIEFDDLLNASLIALQRPRDLPAD